MRHFVYRALFFGLLQLAIAAALWAMYGKDSDAYLASTIDKHERLAKTPSPRLILIGGSETTFGSDSELLERETGLPVVNMATQGGHGLGFKLGEVQPALRRGDVVVISFVYQLYTAETADGLSLLRLLESRPESLRFVTAAEAKAILDGAHLYVREVLRKTLLQVRSGRVAQAGLPYRRSGFNVQGDMVAHREMKLPGIEGKGLDVGELSEWHFARVVGRLNDFAMSAKAAGARVFLFHPPIPASLLEINHERLDRIAAALERELEIASLNHPGELSYPDDHFFDTVYHLSSAGVQKRSAELARLLQSRGVGVRPPPNSAAAQ